MGSMRGGGEYSLFLFWFSSWLNDEARERWRGGKEWSATKTKREQIADRKKLNSGNVNTSAWTQSIITIVLDLWIMAIPLSQLRKLNMDWKKKLAVGLMLCVGVL